MNKLSRILAIPIATFILFSLSLTSFAQESIQGNGNNTSKKKAIDISNAMVTDNLLNEDSVRWYKFVLLQDNSVFLNFTNEDDGAYQYCWYMSIFYSDGKSVIKEGSVEGKGKNTVIELADLEADTYYIKIQRAINGNPLMNGFSDSNYSLSVVDPYENRILLSNGICELDKEGTIFCAINNVLYQKTYDGKAYAALYYYNDKTCLILVGETEDSVISNVMGEGASTSYDGTINYYGVTYYYKTNHSRVDGLVNDALSPNLYLCNDGKEIMPKSAAKEIIRYIMADEPSSGLLLGYVGVELEKSAFFVMGGIIVILSVAVISLLISKRKIAKERDKLKELRSNSTSVSNSSLNSSQSSYSPSIYSSSTSNSDFEKNLNDFNDMQTVMSARIVNTPGYDPEGFTSNVQSYDDYLNTVDDFPDPGSIW